MGDLQNSNSKTELVTLPKTKYELDQEKHTIQLNAEQGQALQEDLEVEIIAKKLPVRIYMTLIWIICAAVFLKFLYDITVQYRDSRKNPSSSISFERVDILPFPKIIVCNWNQDGSFEDPTPKFDCPECQLTLVDCTNLIDFSDCKSDWTHTPIQTNAGLFDCYTYNGDYSDPMFSKSTSYSGSVATIWGTALFNSTDPPTNRAGAQVTFTVLDGSPTNPSDIYNEIRFAPVGLDSFYSLQYVNTIHQEAVLAEGVEVNTSRYDTVSSSVNLLSVPNATYGYIGVSFAFKELSRQINTFFTSYTLENYWGDFAGMVGTLMGLDAIKVAFGFVVAYVAIKIKKINPLEDHFNG